MHKRTLFLISFLLTTAFSFAQDCDCQRNFDWVKKTFEENDAGFEFALNEKGTQAYEDHNKDISEKIKSAETLGECALILNEWLTFFRSGHIGIQIKEESARSNPRQASEKQFSDWETYPLKTEDFKQYLDNLEDPGYEGIWETGPYKIGIRKDGNQYVGFIVESRTETWTEGQIKLKFSIEGDKAKAVFYMRDHSANESEQVHLTGTNLLHIGNSNLSRVYPKIREEAKYERYHKLLKSRSPYLEELNETTLYFRIPSFQVSHKSAIDSVIDANKNKILSTQNLILDIRNGTGGSDSSYKELLPLIYTNPIRVVGMEFLSTKLNNQRMLDFIDKPEYGFDEEGKKWAREAFEKLEERRGDFVNLDESPVTLEKYDTIYPFPRNVGIIINHRNGSTDEQFLLAAKQSKKVKLFGTTTYGVLDISNMYFTSSPCDELTLGYSLSKSLRIPGMTIDGKGLQPDFYLGKDIPLHGWTEYVNQILNESDD